MKKILKWSGIAIVVVGLGIQFVQPERTNPPFDESNTIYAKVQVKPEVREIFERACNDCHSNNTEWPWYSYVAPVSWLVAEDVQEGRAHMNLSQWSEYNTLKSVAKLDQICEELTDDKMPLKQYRLMHSKARLSKAEIDMICDWVDVERERLLSSAFEPSNN